MEGFVSIEFIAFHSL